MLACLRTAAVYGVEACPVHVEVDVSFGLPQFTMVGLPDASVRESRDRVRSAIRNSGFAFPEHRVTVNLAPADVRKAGSAFDLPIALGILAAQGVVERRHVADLVLLGELSLDGSIHAARGVLPIAVAARRDGLAGMLLPVANAREAAIVSGLDVFPVSSLAEAVRALNDPSSLPAAPIDPTPARAPAVADLADVRGQLLARRALEIASAGGHNLLLDRSARRRKNDDGPARAREFCRCSPSTRLSRRPPCIRLRVAADRDRTAGRSAVPGAAPHDFRRRADRRRIAAPAG